MQPVAAHYQHVLQGNMLQVPCQAMVWYGRPLPYNIHGMVWYGKGLYGKKYYVVILVGKWWLVIV